MVSVTDGSHNNQTPGHWLFSCITPKPSCDCCSCMLLRNATFAESTVIGEIASMSQCLTCPCGHAWCLASASPQPCNKCILHTIVCCTGAQVPGTQICFRLPVSHSQDGVGQVHAVPEPPAGCLPCLAYNQFVDPVLCCNWRLLCRIEA